MALQIVTRSGRQLALWAVSSVGGLAANLLLLTLWVDYFDIPAEIAIVPNWILIAAGSYWFNDSVVFADYVPVDSIRGHVRQFLGSESIMLGSKGINYLIYILLLQVVDYRVAWLIGAVTVFGVTFALNRWWWRRSANPTPN